MPATYTDVVTDRWDFGRYFSNADEKTGKKKKNLNRTAIFAHKVYIGIFTGTRFYRGNGMINRRENVASRNG